MQRLLHRIHLAAFVLVLNGSADAASFDCATARTTVEKIICLDPRLSRLDGELSAVYKRLRAGDGRNQSLTLSQRKWLQNRDRCEDITCLDRHYLVRLAELARWTERKFTVPHGKDNRLCQAVALELNARLASSPSRICAFEVVSSMRGMSGPQQQLSIADSKDLYRRFKLPDIVDGRQLPPNLDSLLAKYDRELNTKWERAVQNGHFLYAADNVHTSPYLAVTEVLPASEDHCPLATSLLFTSDRKSIRFNESDVIAARLPIAFNGDQYWLGQNLQSLQGVTIPVSDQVFFGTTRLLSDACHIQLSSRIKRR